MTSTSRHLNELRWMTGDISPCINEALADCEAVELPPGKLPGYLGAPLYAKHGGQKLLGRGTEIEVQHGETMYSHPSYLGASSYPMVAGLKLRRTVPGGPYAHGIHIGRIVEKARIEDVHIIGAHHGFNVGPTDDSMLDSCTAESCTGNGFHIVSQGPVGMALQWSSRDCRALLNQGSGMYIHAIRLDEPPSQHGVSCGTHQGFTTYANRQHGVHCVGTPDFPLHEPRFTGGFIGGDRYNLMYFDTFADIRVIGTRLELSEERHGIYTSPLTRHAWLKGLTITGGRVPGSYGLYAQGQYLHLSDSEIYNFGASGVYSDAVYGWICGLQSAGNANYGLFLEHPNFRVYALSCYDNGLGDFGGPTPGVFI